MMTLPSREHFLASIGGCAAAELVHSWLSLHLLQATQQLSDCLECCSCSLARSVPIAPCCALLAVSVSCAGETEETALPRAEEVVSACVAVHNSVMQLFDGIDMPASNVWFWPGSK
jgi:hypothetical protein